MERMVIMTDLPETPEVDRRLPEASVTRRRWNLSMAWIVPLAAAIVAGYLVYGLLQQFGPNITIRFKDGSGVKAGQTAINYRGVQIGQVTAVELSQDHQAVLVKARLQRSAASLAKERSMFWIVRPEVGLDNITGLGTVITGPEIDVLPGSGKEQSEFVGLERAPAAAQENGLTIILSTGQLGSLRTGSPVFYRGIEVGNIRDCQLSPNAAKVLIKVFIKQRYARVVRNSSKFWSVSGVDVNLSFSKGLQINMESLRSLALGGLAFATPDDPKDEPAKEGMIFPLFEKPSKEWLEWAPKIQLVTVRQSSAARNVVRKE
jgi:paraquat-inducible protein B